MILIEGTGFSEIPKEELIPYINACFIYQKETGEISWKEERPKTHFRTECGYKIWKGHITRKKSLGSLFLGKYKRFRFNGKNYLNHRFIWLIVTGDWPVRQIDHINGDGLDNSWVNLREVSPSENSQNRKRRTDNTSGYTGVYYFKDRDSWVARGVCYEGESPRVYEIVSGVSYEDAVKARKDWERLSGGITERHGK